MFGILKGGKNLEDALNQFTEVSNSEPTRRQFLKTMSGLLGTTVVGCGDDKRMNPQDSQYRSDVATAQDNVGNALAGAETVAADPLSYLKPGEYSEGPLDFLPDGRPEYTKINYDNPKLQQKIDQEVFEDDFLDEVEDMCYRLDMHCMALISVMDHETGGTFDPSKRSRSSSGTGLIQFMNETAKYLGTTTKDLAEMSQIEQLEYVELFFNKNKRRGAKYSNPDDVALTVFWPAAAGKSPNHVIAVKGDGVYEANRGGDKNNDEKITVDERVGNCLSKGYLIR